MARQQNESAIEYLRRIVNNLDMEYDMDSLPTVEACIEYFELWNTYDTDFWEGMMEAISEGADPKPLQDFIAKHKLPWTIPEHVLEAAR